MNYRLLTPISLYTATVLPVLSGERTIDPHFSSKDAINTQLLKKTANLFSCYHPVISETHSPFLHITDFTLSDEPAAGLLVKSHLYALWAILYSHSQEGQLHHSGDSINRERVRMVLSYLEEHASDSLTIDFLAQLINVSPAYLSHIFKEQTGTGVISFLNRLRIQRSLSLLQNTNRTISDIASDCGFNSTCFFNRKFQELMNCTPGKYRRLCADISGQPKTPSL